MHLFVMSKPVELEAIGFDPTPLGKSQVQNLPNAKKFKVKPLLTRMMMTLFDADQVPEYKALAGGDIITPELR